MSKLSVIAIEERARIAEHAFRAGFTAGVVEGALAEQVAEERGLDHWGEAVPRDATDKAWNAYEPEDER